METKCPLPAGSVHRHIIPIGLAIEPSVCKTWALLNTKTFADVHIEDIPKPGPGCR